MTPLVERSIQASRILEESEGWPAHDRDRWRSCFGADLRFSGSSPWSEATRRQIAWVYGRYVSHTQADGLPPALNPSGVRSFAAAALERGCAPRSVARYVQCLALVVAVLFPGQGQRFTWLTTLSTTLLKAAAGTPKQKAGRQGPAEDILALGLAEMAQADLSSGSWNDYRRFRNGLILALWICLPERLQAFTAIGLRDIAPDLSWIDFPEDHQKTGTAIRRVVPAFLRPHLRRYLDDIRGIHAWNHDRLWVVQGGAPAGPKALYGVVRELTGRGLGVALSPHRLRDCAARFVVEEMTSEVRLASVLLNHRDERSTAPYIEGASTLLAARKATALVKQSEAKARRA